MKGLFILLLATALVPQVAGAGEPPGAGKPPVLVRAAPILKHAAIVEGDLIRMGDIFDNAGKQADVPVAYAPKPGRQAVLELDQLWSIARAHGVQWRPRSRFERVVVTRASQTIGGKEIRVEVERALAGLDGTNGLDGEHWIELDRRNPLFHLPKELPRTLALRNFQYRNGRFTAMLHAPAAAPVIVTAISGRVEKMHSIPILKRSMEPGELIRKSDIGWLKLRARKVTQRIITGADSLIGQTPRRPVRAGIPLRRGDVQAQILVTKGKLVRMTYRTGFMELTTRGRALEGGAMGDVIKIMNLKSKKVVEAAVTGPGQATILATRTLSISQLPPGISAGGGSSKNQE